MKCINDETIQKYMDGETNAQETENIEKHAASCAVCAQKIAEQRRFASHIKRGIENWGAEPVSIPEFVAPAIPKRRFNIKIKTKYYMYATSAAACAILLIFLLLPKENKANEYQMIYCFDGDFDSNRT